MGEKHKHAELIKAFVDGIDIQMRYKESHRKWKEVATLRDFGYVNYEYRFKPKEKQKVKRWLWVMKGKNSMGKKVVMLGSNYWTTEEAQDFNASDKMFKTIEKAIWSEIEVEEDDD